MFSDWMKTQAIGAAVTFAFVMTLGTPAAAQVRKADFNGDGHGDLAIGSPLMAPVKRGSGRVNIVYGDPAAGGLASAHSEMLYPVAVPLDLPSDSHLGSFGSAIAWGDFDNDGFTDLAVGMPGYGRYSRDDHIGAVRVYYGEKLGLRYADTQIFTGDDLDDYFGSSLAVGNFNGDEYMDLAIGAPQGGLIGFYYPGWIRVLYGGEEGLSLTGADTRSQASVGIPGEPELGDAFGFSLAAGDFGFGPEDDLAVGVPGENNGAGAVNIIYGSQSSHGLTDANAQLLQQGADGMAGAREVNDYFGWSLAAADFNLNGHADLAIGSPGEDIGLMNVGLVHVVYGGPNGLDTYFGQAFGQDWGEFDLAGSAAASDHFGWSLAAGNFGQDSAADLAVGVPGDVVNGRRAGAVNVIYGAFFLRLTATKNQLWAQTDAGSGDLLGASEDGDLFGGSLSAQNVGFGSRADLVIGVPGEGVSGTVHAGVVNVIFSTASGLNKANNQMWTLESATSSPGSANAGDYFGFSVGAADTTGFLTVLFP
jgi:FG-GAP repeat